MNGISKSFTDMFVQFLTPITGKAHDTLIVESGHLTEFPSGFLIPAALFLLAVVLAVFVNIIASRIQQTSWKRDLRPKNIMNKSELKFFHMLKKVLSNNFIFPEVSFNSLLDAKRSKRAQFN